jgi:hypothetical protein
MSYFSLDFFVEFRYAILMMIRITKEEKMMVNMSDIRVARMGDSFFAMLDGYDGSPDAAPRDCMQGFGDSAQEAIQNLLEKYEDLEN